MKPLLFILCIFFWCEVEGQVKEVIGLRHYSDDSAYRYVGGWNIQWYVAKNGHWVKSGKVVKRTESMSKTIDSTGFCEFYKDGCHRFEEPKIFNTYYECKCSMLFNYTTGKIERNCFFYH